MKALKIKLNVVEMEPIDHKEKAERMLPASMIADMGGIDRVMELGMLTEKYSRLLEAAESFTFGLIKDYTAKVKTLVPGQNAYANSALASMSNAVVEAKQRTLKNMLRVMEYDMSSDMDAAFTKAFNAVLDGNVPVDEAVEVFIKPVTPDEKHISFAQKYLYDWTSAADAARKLSEIDG